MDYAVLGVGINLTFDEKNAPKELQDVGGGLFQSTTPVGARQTDRRLSERILYPVRLSLPKTALSRKPRSTPC